MPPSPSDVVRTELRAGLHDLSDALLQGTSSRQSLTDSTDHLRIQLQLAELDDHRTVLVYDLLLEVAEALAVPEDLDRHLLASQVSVAADRV